MNTRANRKSLPAWLMLMLCMIFSAIIAVAVIAPHKVAAADETQDNVHGYYYSQLRASKLAERLYDTLWYMYAKGYFETCTEQYDLTTVLTQSELGDYVINKSPAIPVALGAARDAFYLDHPELFYVSVHDMRLMFGSDGTEHKAYLGAGKADNYYEEFTATSAAEVKLAVADFNTQLDKAVAAAKKDGADVVRQIKNANEYLCGLASYDYGAYDDKHGGLAYNGYVNTAYGILNSQQDKAGKALCEGYAKAFKVIMDKLSIPCVLVAGASCNGIDGVDSDGNKLESGYEPHMWNAVKVDGQWYGVDVCWNDTENKHGKYTLVGELSLMSNRYEDPVISSSEYKVRYPVLRALDYGEFTDSNGFEFMDSGKVGDVELGYDASGLVGVSYEDKNINQLKAEGKYLAIRLGDDEPWVDYTAYIDFLSDNTESEVIVDKYTLFIPYMAEEFSQFAIIDIAPDSTTELGIMSAGTWENLDTKHILAVSAKYNNQDFGVAKGKPFIKSMTPNEKGYIMNYEPTEISITYDEPLQYESVVDKTVGIEVTAERKDISPKVENVVWHEDTNTVTFTFTPSSPYAHNSLAYNFVPTNLMGKDTGERPEAGRLAFKRDEVICPKVFNDGRLYLKIYGTPEFVSASDESLNQFKDKNDQPIVNQRSQLMLVINRPTKAENEQMEELAKTTGDTVISSSTYEINLQMCGVVRKIPDGSFMQVGFGFPEGMSPDDAGTTFTVYHYTRNPDGTIKDVEPVPCVVTEYGVIATVKSFSPFMICAVTSDSPSVKNIGKMVLASVDGVGGNLDNKDIVSVKNGESVTYTITKESGYDIDRVLVNGVDKKASVTADGKLTLNESELGANNTVVVSFVSARAAKFIADNNIQVVEHSLVVTDSDMIVAYVDGDPTPGPGKDNTAIIVIAVVVSVVVLAGVGVALFLIFRKKKATQTASAGKAKTAKSENAKAKTQNKPATEQAVAKNAPTKTTTTQQRPATQQRSTTTQQRQTTQQRSTTTQQRPATTQQRPATTQQRPATTQQRPATTQQRPATTQQRTQSSATTRTTGAPQRQSGASAQRPTAHTSQRPSGASTKRPSGTTARPQSGTTTRNTHNDRKKSR